MNEIHANWQPDEKLSDRHCSVTTRNGLAKFRGAQLLLWRDDARSVVWLDFFGSRGPLNAGAILPPEVMDELAAKWLQMRLEHGDIK